MVLSQLQVAAFQPALYGKFKAESWNKNGASRLFGVLPKISQLPLISEQALILLRMCLLWERRPIALSGQSSS